MRFKRWLRILGVVLALLLVVKWWLLDTAADPGDRFAIDMGSLHQVATSGGALPERIEVERIGDFAFPQTLVVAGSGFRSHPMVLLSHRVVWGDRTLIIDTAMAPEATKQMPGSSVDTAAYVRMQTAMQRATTILFTHEHDDHVGGAAKAADFASLAPRVSLTREQLESPKLTRDAFPPDALARLTPLAYQGLYAVAPGVVLQKAPGHSPGTQLIYVELANGTKFLFVGDIAWSFDNIREQRGRPALARLLMNEDRAAVAAQVRALAELPRDVHVVVAHDPVALQADLAAGLYKSGFSGL